MLKTFRTLELIPSVPDKRFGRIEIGSSSIETVREEFTTLRAVAAAVLGVDPEAVTPDGVASIPLDKLRELCAAYT